MIMLKKALICSVTVLSGICSLSADDKASVKSPDGHIRFTLCLDREGVPSYRVDYRGSELIKDARLGFVFDDCDFSGGISTGKVIKSSGTEVYDLVVGKCSHVEDRYNRIVVPLTRSGRQVDLEVKAFDSGVAFRYIFKPSAGCDSCVILDELTSFDLAGDPRMLTMYLGSYTTSHEGFYTDVPYGSLQSSTLMEMPTLAVYASGACMALTEAAVLDYAGMYLMMEDGHMRGKLSPLPGRDGVKVVAPLPHRTPWRVMMIGSQPGDLIASNLLTSLNDPCAFDDTSWIRPGKTTFTWWNGNVVPDSYFLPGNNFHTNKYYIDWAADNGLDFHNVYGYAEQPWYHDPNMSFEFPSDQADVTRTVSSLDMDAIGDYVRGKGMGLHMWVHWRPLVAQLDSALTQFERWGVKGMMVDFMDRDDQEMIRIQERVLKAAADHKIFVQFHGSSKPSGLNRTYPNEFAREGTRNYECYKWSKDLGADFDIAIPFTRLLAGVTDYHLGGFRAVTPDKFQIRYTNPLVTNTRCHMLGMYVVLECYLGMVCDTPAAYEGQEGFDFIRKVPTSWDETVVPAAEVMEYACVARRSGHDWYVGVINNSTPRTLSFKTDFLASGQYEAEIYCDAPDSAENPNKLEKRLMSVDRNGRCSIDLASCGGAAIRIYPVDAR